MTALAHGAAPSRMRPSYHTQLSAAVGALLLAWELLPRLGLVKSFFLPPASAVLQSMYDLAQDAVVRGALLQMAIMVLISFGLAAVIGVAVAVVIGVSDFAYRTIHPAVLLLFSTPKMIFVPLFILLLGIGSTSKIAYGFSSAVFPIIITVTAGVRDIDPRFLKAGRSLGASRIQEGVFISVPATVPAVVTALWYGLKASLLGVLIMELFASQRGLGYLIRLYTSSFRTERVFALIVALSVVVGLVGTVWSALERRTDEWRTAP